MKNPYIILTAIIFHNDFFWQDCVNKVIQPAVLWNFFLKIALWESAAVWLVARTYFVDALWTLGIWDYPSFSVHLPRRINQMRNYDSHKILHWNKFYGIVLLLESTNLYQFSTHCLLTCCAAKRQLTSRKIWMTEKSCNFHTVKSTLTLRLTEMVYYSKLVLEYVLKIFCKSNLRFELDNQNN